MGISLGCGCQVGTSRVYGPPRGRSAGWCGPIRRCPALNAEKECGEPFLARESHHLGWLRDLLAATGSSNRHCTDSPGRLAPVTLLHVLLNVVHTGMPQIRRRYNLRLEPTGGRTEQCTDDL